MAPSYMRSISPFFAGILGLLGASAAAAATVEVTLSGESFSPATVRITVGDTVRWTNQSGVHNVVARNGTFTSGSPALAPFVFTHTFPTAGTFDYFCQVHEAMGMTGRVIVSPAAEPRRGQIRLGQPSFSATEGATVEIPVERVGGDDGAVGITFTASGDGATAGVDFTPVTGQLTWADHDDSTKNFLVVSFDDAVAEAPEAVLLTLSNVTGGASLGTPSTAVLTLLDDDGAPSGGLTAQQSRCDGQRLAGLLDRLRVTSPNTAKVPGINLSLTASGDFAGLAYTGNGPGTPEHHLAFSTNPEETTLLRNPVRLPLGSLSATRNDLNSDVVDPADVDFLRVSLNPTLANDPAPSALLVIDNAAQASAARPGRGLAGVLARCEPGLGDADIFLFRVLTKIVRAEAAGAKSFEIAIYRGPDVGLFRLDAWPIDAGGAALGRLSAELLTDVAVGVPLGSGTLRLLGTCGPNQTADCSTLAAGALSLVPPVASGELYPVPPPVRVTVGGPAVDFFWPDVLGASPWGLPQ